MMGTSASWWQPIVFDALPTLVASLLSEQPEDQGDYDTDEDRGGNGKVEAKILSLDDDVSRQAAQADSCQPRPGKPDDDERNSDDDQRS